MKKLYSAIGVIKKEFKLLGAMRCVAASPHREIGEPAHDVGISDRILTLRTEHLSARYGSLLTFTLYVLCMYCTCSKYCTLLCDLICLFCAKIIQKIKILGLR